MLRLKLKAICFDTDFRCNEKTNYEKFKRSSAFPGVLGSNEVYLFVSRGGDQLVWLINGGDAAADKQLVAMNGYDVTDSRKWRLTGGSWNPLMLQNYAEEVGIQLVGLKRFEEQYLEYRERRLKAERERRSQQP